MRPLKPPNLTLDAIYLVGWTEFAGDSEIVKDHRDDAGLSGVPELI